MATYEQRLMPHALEVAADCRGMGNWTIARRYARRQWTLRCWKERIPRTTYSWRTFRDLVRRELRLDPMPRQMTLIER